MCHIFSSFSLTSFIDKYQEFCVTSLSYLWLKLEHLQSFESWKVNLDSHLYLMTFFHLTKIRCYVLDTFIFLYFIFWMCHWVSNSMMSFSCKIYYVAMVMIKYVKVHFWCFLNPYLSRQKTLFDWYRRS